MKQKIVIRVSMDDDKSRTKALKISVCISGVESAALKGDQVEVVGEGIDAVELTRQLRKNMSYADLVSVGELEAKKDSTNPNPGPAKLEAHQIPSQPFWVYPPPPPYDGSAYGSYGYGYPPQPQMMEPPQNQCTIM